MSQVATNNPVIARWETDTVPADEAMCETVSEANGTVITPASVDQKRTKHITCGREQARRPLSACPPWKRIMDIIGVTVGLLVLSPLLFGIAAFIKCVSGGPVLYRQRRYGLNGRPFEVWKFRTIEVSHEPDNHHSHVSGLMASNQPLKKLDHKLDVIPGGGMLRGLGIDELPQLFNVLRGEMSLVGPRPDVVPFDQYDGWHRRRFDVLPGITGLWQVSGKNERTFVEMMCLDMAYVRRRSLWLDIRILLLTLPAIALD
jgi:lipopolysaccharide/colanic/teichoic acid biosynthesis glycosyltransferase